MKKKIKIGVISPSRYFKGGIFTFTSIIAEIFESSYYVNRVYFNKQIPLAIYPAKDRVKQERANNLVLNENEIINWYNPFSWVKAFRKFIKNSDILYLPWWTILVSLPLLLIATMSKISGIKIIIEFHNIYDHNANYVIKKISRYLIKAITKKADIIIVHSKSDEEKLKEINIKKIKIYRIPLISFNFLLNKKENFETKSLKEKLNIDKETNVLLQFGIVRPYKGLEFSIKATKILLEKGYKVKLLIVGENWINKKEIEDLIELLNLKNNVIWIEKFVPDEEINLYFNIADIALFPYLSASQSGSAQIAFASGIPVVASKVGGFKDLIKDKKNGIFCEPEDEYSLARGIEALLKDESLKQKIVLNAKKTIVENTDLKKIKNEYLKLINILSIY